MKMSQVMISACVVGMMTVGASFAANETKIGTFDMQKALQTVNAGKRAKEKLEKEFQARQKEIEGEKTAFDKAKAEYEKQMLVLSDDAKRKKEKELSEKFMKLQQSAQKTEMEFRQKERDATSPLLEQLKKTAETVAKDKGYTIILEKNESSVMISPTSDDITSAVISTFDEKNKS